MTNTPIPKHVFMSYSRKDEAVMRRVAGYLRKQSINVWVDNEKLVPGTPIWEEEIERAIINSGAVVVLLSPDSKQSPWVRREISYAERYHKRIFPVMVAGDEGSSITLRLSVSQYVDIRKNEKLGLTSLLTALSSYLNYLDEKEIQEQREEVERLAREKAVKEKAAKEKAKREAAEKVAKEKAEREATEKAAREKAERKAAEKTAKGKVEREAAEKAAREKTEKETKERVERNAVEKKAKGIDERLTTTIVVREKTVRWRLWVVVIVIAILGFLWIGSLLYPQPGTINYSSELTSRASSKPAEHAAENLVEIAKATPTPNAKATSTARAIAGATAVAPVYASLTEKAKYFYDDFSNNSNGWATGSTNNEWWVGSRSIQSGVYKWDITETKKNFYYWQTISTFQSVQDFHIAVDSKLIKGNSSTLCFGVFFRRDSSKNAYYVFSICDNQRYSIKYFSGSEWEYLIYYKDSSIIKSGDWNKIEVFANSSQFEFYINNQKVEEITDTHLMKGYYGLLIDSISSVNPGQIWFDNFEFELR